MLPKQFLARVAKHGTERIAGVGQSALGIEQMDAVSGPTDQYSIAPLQLLRPVQQRELQAGRAENQTGDSGGQPWVRMRGSQDKKNQQQVRQQCGQPGQAGQESPFLWQNRFHSVLTKTFERRSVL